LAPKSAASVSSYQRALSLPGAITVVGMKEALLTAPSRPHSATTATHAPITALLRLSAKPAPAIGRLYCFGNSGVYAQTTLGNVGVYVRLVGG
jgi:hypothetical protein